MEGHLEHYSRRTSSEHINRNFLEIVDALLRSVNCADPDAYVKSPPRRRGPTFSDSRTG